MLLLLRSVKDNEVDFTVMLHGMESWVHIFILYPSSLFFYPCLLLPFQYPGEEMTMLNRTQHQPSLRMSTEAFPSSLKSENSHSPYIFNCMHQPFLH